MSKHLKAITRHDCPCGRPIQDQAVLCRRCVEYFTRDLGDITALASEVETTRTRQSRTGGAAIGGGHSSDRPLPWDERPALAAAELNRVLHSWCSRVAASRGTGLPAESLTAQGRYLLAAVRWLVHQDDAPAAKQQLEQAIWKLRRSIDRHVEREYLGTCGSMEYGSDGQPILCSARCPADLYVRPHAKQVTCPSCGTVHDTTGRKEWLVESVQNELAAPAELSRALSSLVRPVPDATIRSWVLRGRLFPKGVDARGRHLYRVGDAVELLLAEASRRAG